MFSHEAAVPQFKRAVGKGCDLFGVGHDQEGHPVVLVQVLEQRQDFTAGDRVERTGRLVGQNQARLRDEGTGDGHALLFTTAQHGRQGADTVRHSEAVKHGVGQGEGLLRRHALMTERLGDVVTSVEVGQEVAFLEDERDRLLTQFNQFLTGQSGHVLARQTDRAGAGFHQTAKALHEGGFSRTRRADHGDGLAGLHVDVKTTQRHDVAVLGFGFVDVVEAVSMQNRIAHLHSPFSTLAKSAFSARRVVTNNATTTAAKTARDTRMIWAHG